MHQNTIQSLCVLTLSADCVLVVTGGDDNGLSLTMVRAIPSQNDKFLKAPELIMSTLSVPRAHAAAVSACAILSVTNPLEESGKVGDSLVRLRLLTASKDQRVKLWDIKVDSSMPGVEGVDVEKVTSTHTQVADISSMAVLERETQDPRHRVLLCGVGMEVLVVER